MPESVSIDRFENEELRGEVLKGAGLDSAAATASWLADPANALETIHWGRNYLYSAVIETSEGQTGVVVKQFRHQTLRQRLDRRLRGSKAERSWRMALAMSEAGVPTPEPLIWTEPRSADGASLFVTRQVPESLEARYVFRALKAGTLRSEFPWLDREAFVAALGRLARAMHDAGFWHRDFSIGNVLIEQKAEGKPRLWVIDLNRARARARVTVSQRLRDLSRLGFSDPRDERRMLASYWEGRESGDGLKRSGYRFYRSLYLGRVEGRKRLRGLTAGLRGMLFERKAYAHIPPPPEEAGVRERSVWDQLSDQPHQHATRGDRLRVRIADSGIHARAFGGALVAAPRAWGRYRRLLAQAWSQPASWPGAGIAVGPESAPNEEVVAALEASGSKHALLRLHPWDSAWKSQEDLAAELSGRGFDLTFALPQVRELVRDPERWAAAVSEIGERFVPHGRRFQLGQAINRSKWGVWNNREFAQMASRAAGILRSQGEVEILGPGIIDFEPHALAAALNYPGMPEFDVISSLLYVDRRGGPENRQLGFDTLGKAALMRAIGETARVGSGRFWVTEVNWPLWEGPHSPAGKTVSVDENSQADYLVRYFVPLLGSGLAERAYWWQLVARGYGLVDSRADELRRRPSFEALATLNRQLAGTRCEGPVAAGEEARLYRFSHPQRGTIFVGWSLGEEVKVGLPQPVEIRVSRDGEASSAVGGATILTVSPQYFSAAD
jgi:tRNA A-37 threonylcarbamoyl transferase component Bud32